MSDFVLFVIATAGTITGNVIARVIDREWTARHVRKQNRE